MYTVGKYAAFWKFTLAGSPKAPRSQPPLSRSRRRVPTVPTNSRLAIAPCELAPPALADAMRAQLTGLVGQIGPSAQLRHDRRVLRVARHPASQLRVLAVRKRRRAAAPLEWRSQASDVRSSSREARFLPPTDAQAQKSRKLCGSHTSVARLATCVSCYYVSSRGDLEACWNKILTIFDPYTFLQWSPQEPRACDWTV